ncbi:MAG: hypothetical protein R2845_12965 [Thermomicrobiales bacterium]
MLTLGYVLHGVTFLSLRCHRKKRLDALLLLPALQLALSLLDGHHDLSAEDLAMGVSLSHVTAIVVPILGAALWTQLGYKFPFLFGTIFVVLSLISTQRIDKSKESLEHFRT